MRRHHQLLIGIVILAALLVALRVALPYVVRHQINKEMAHLGDYRGHVEDALLRGGIERRKRLREDPGYEIPYGYWIPGNAKDPLMAVFLLGGELWREVIDAVRRLA